MLCVKLRPTLIESTSSAAVNRVFVASTDRCRTHTQVAWKIPVLLSVPREKARQSDVDDYGSGSSTQMLRLRQVEREESRLSLERGSYLETSATKISRDSTP